MRDDELRCKILNCDETGFCIAIASKKILRKHGDKDMHETMGGSNKEYVTCYTKT